MTRLKQHVDLLIVDRHHLFTQVLISRGLQLEGQVVTEEQDLQVLVMGSQKSSPIQYLHASTMQERVRAAVAQSQVSHYFLVDSLIMCFPVSDLCPLYPQALHVITHF